MTRRFGVERPALIENAVQDASLRALERWPEAGPPEDALRRERPTRVLDTGPDVPVDPPKFDGDDGLRLMFLWCDPVLPRAAQVTLVLNVAFGLNARQIATAFVRDERTVTQRMVRAKQRLRDEGVRFDVPHGVALPARRAAILDVLYVGCSEGYHPTDDAAALDAALCNEALRLVRLLTETQLTSVAPAFALPALLCFHASRVPARVADDGALLLMPEQDRAPRPARVARQRSGGAVVSRARA